MVRSLSNLDVRHRENSIYFSEQFKTSRHTEEILNYLRSYDIFVYADSTREYEVLDSQLYYKIIEDKNTRWLPLNSSKDSVLYLRKVVPQYYVIPKYVLGSDTLRNIEFTIQDSEHRTTNKTIVQIISMEANSVEDRMKFHSQNKSKAYRKHFKNLFR